MDKNKKLMFAVSVALPKAEVLSFGKTMPDGDNYYIYKVRENPRARDAFRRESWVLLRDLRNGEISTTGNALFVDKKELLHIN